MTTQAAQDIPRHPIGVVTRRTGLSAHVLRAWERRHAVVQPQRGESGHRLYSDGDVERLCLLSSVTRSGRPLASVAGLPVDGLRALLDEDARRSSPHAGSSTEFRAQAMECVVALDPCRLESRLRRALLTLGTMAFLEDVMVPLMAEIGERWHAGSLGIAQEHAASSVAQQLLGALIRELEDPDATRRVVLATPAGERHVLGGLLAAATAAHDGWSVTWLGSDLPAAQIATAAIQGRARLVALSATAESADLREEVCNLRRQLPRKIALAAGGAGTGGLRKELGVHHVRDLSQWRALLRLQAAMGRE